MSLTEDPEFELVPCQTPGGPGRVSVQRGHVQRHPRVGGDQQRLRDFQKSAELPSQLDGDMFDVRGMMHRDGSVFSAVSLEDLKNPELLYNNLGAKMVVGMLKDIATTDSIYLPESARDSRYCLSQGHQTSSRRGGGGACRHRPTRS